MNTTTPVQITEYCRDLFNLQYIIDAFWLVKSAAPWKSSIQKYELNLLPETCKLQKSIFEGTYRPSKPNEFNISERGKTRHIKSSCINDRIVGHILCDHVLIPTLTPYLIYDNGASLKGKGISFTRNRIATHLHRYYRNYGTNKGYVLLMDFSKYYDNIVHSTLLNMIAKYVTDPYILYLLDITFKNYRVDISYMSPEEAEYALYKKFDAIEYCKISKDLLTGERYLDKSISIGDQVSQISAIFYPHQIDNYCKIVKSLKYYDRYMDDTIIIHPDFNTLNSLVYEITDIANSLGIFYKSKENKNNSIGVRIRISEDKLLSNFYWSCKY